MTASEVVKLAKQKYYVLANDAHVSERLKQQALGYYLMANIEYLNGNVQEALDCAVRSLNISDRFVYYKVRPHVENLRIMGDGMMHLSAGR
jgi:hypothetical protein